MDASCIGIDLGTMFTTAAASNGGRSCIRSEVGFARDAIAKHLIGEDIVIGELVNKRGILDLKPPRMRDVGHRIVLNTHQAWLCCLKVL